MSYTALNPSTHREHPSLAPTLTLSGDNMMPITKIRHSQTARLWWWYHVCGVLSADILAAGRVQLEATEAFMREDRRASASSGKEPSLQTREAVWELLELGCVLRLPTNTTRSTSQPTQPTQPTACHLLTVRCSLLYYLILILPAFQRLNYLAPTVHNPCIWISTILSLFPYTSSRSYLSASYYSCTNSLIPRATRDIAVCQGREVGFFPLTPCRRSTAYSQHPSQAVSDFQLLNCMSNQPLQPLQ